MANLTSTLLSHADMEVILTAVKAYFDAEVSKANGDTTAVANKVNTLIGAVAGDDTKSVRAISAEEVAKIVNENNNGSIDTLNEIAAWIINDTTGAAKMANDIAAALEAIGTNGETKSGLHKDIADEASRADAAEKANKKAIEDEVTRATGVEEGLDERIGDLEALFDGDNSVDAKIAAAQKAAEDHSDANKAELSGTAVSSTNTNGPVTVTLGGTVGAPTVTVAVTMATAEEVKVLTDLFAIAESAE